MTPRGAIFREQGGFAVMIRVYDRCLPGAMGGQHDPGICANAEDTSMRGTNYEVSSAPLAAANVSP
jgi:hypothetical protein